MLLPFLRLVENDHCGCRFYLLSNRNVTKALKKNLKELEWIINLRFTLLLQNAVIHFKLSSKLSFSFSSPSLSKKQFIVLEYTEQAGRKHFRFPGPFSPNHAITYSLKLS